MYQTFCSRYGKGYFLLGMMAPWFGGQGLIFVNAGSGICLMAGAAFGAAGVMKVEASVPRALSRRRVGITRGSRILQGAQLGVYTATMGAFAAAAAMVGMQPHKPAASPHHPQPTAGLAVRPPRCK